MGRTPFQIFGEPMKRGSLRCQKCSHTRTARSCPHCGHDSVYIRINWKGKEFHYWRDKTGNAFSFSEACITLREINQKIDQWAFNPKEYLASTIREMKFQASFEKWLQVKEKEAQEGRLAFETLRAYRSYHHNHFGPLNALDVREIKLKDLQGLLEELRAPLSLNFKRRLFQCLHSFFGWLIRWGTLKELPIFPEIIGDDARVKRAIPYELQVEAIGRLHEEHRDIFLFMRETGVRIGEACAVQVGDLDQDRVWIQRTWSGKRLVETTKQRKKQTVSLSVVAQDVTSRNKEGKLPRAFLFVNPDTHRGYRDEYLRRLWKQYSGIDITLYEAMRHSTITDWAGIGSAFEVQQSARHTDMRTTMKYVHSVSQGLSKMVNRQIRR